MSSCITSSRMFRVCICDVCCCGITTINDILFFCDGKYDSIYFHSGKSNNHKTVFQLILWTWKVCMLTLLFWKKCGQWFFHWCVTMLVFIFCTIIAMKNSIFLKMNLIQKMVITSMYRYTVHKVDAEYHLHRYL